MFIASSPGISLSNFFSFSQAGDTNESLFNNARFAMEFFLRKIGLGNRGTLLMPEYICYDFVEFLSRNGHRIMYYHIDDKLQPHISDLEMKLKQGERNMPFVVIVVHYFGFIVKEILRIQTLCDKAKAILFEDCAHLPYCNDVVNRLSGTGAIFSLKKHLPLSDGGLLYLQKNTLSSDNEYRKLHRKKSYYKRVLKGLLVSPLMNCDFGMPKKWPSIDYDETKEHYYDGNCRVRISLISEFLWKKLNGLQYTNKIVTVKKANFLYYLKKLQGLGNNTFRPLYTGLGGRDIPYMFPLVFEMEAEKFVNYLRKCGIPAISWPELGVNSPRRAFELRNNMAFLPLHQDISKSHIDYIILKIQAFLYS